MMNSIKIEPIKVNYLDHLGTDLTVVNAARASFGKRKTVFDPRDEKLIKFLALGYKTEEWNDILDLVQHSELNRNDASELLRSLMLSPQHWAPFAHPQVQLELTIPLFLARQLVKHQVGAVWSEESRRYISEDPSYWFPSEVHSRPDNIKQGSGTILLESDNVIQSIIKSTSSSHEAYKDLLNRGVAPEEARLVLPTNTMTNIVWTGSLLFWARVYNLRSDNHAQKAANDFASYLEPIIKKLFPISWKYLTVPGALIDDTN